MYKKIEWWIDLYRESESEMLYLLFANKQPKSWNYIYVLNNFFLFSHLAWTNVLDFGSSAVSSFYRANKIHSVSSFYIHIGATQYTLFYRNILCFSYFICLFMWVCVCTNFQLFNWTSILIKQLTASTRSSRTCTHTHTPYYILYERIIAPHEDFIIGKCCQVVNTHIVRKLTERITYKIISVTAL